MQNSPTEATRVLANVQVVAAAWAGAAGLLLAFMQVPRLFRVHYEASKRRRKDAVRVRKPRPSKITLENVNEHEEAPGG